MDLVEKSNFFLSAFFTEIKSEISFLILWKERNDFKWNKNLSFKKGQKMFIFQTG